jgi:hypothetical protein
VISRRVFVVTMGWALLAAPLAAEGSSPRGFPVVGLLNYGSCSSQDAFASW